MITLHPLQGIPPVEPGDDLAALVLESARRSGIELCNGALVICQKVVSKSEGRVVKLDTIEPSAEARQIAREPP